MSADREPLHQPPNPDDLRLRPPRTAECAFVRGLLRDFVDADLDAEQGRSVEEHVSLCRSCSVELGRAEHERMLIRNLFAGVRKLERAAVGGGRLPSGFAARVVDRMVVDETSMIPAAAMQRAAAAADAAVATARTTITPPSGPLWLQLLAATVALLLLLLVGTWWFERTGAPENFARLVVISATGTSDWSGRRIGNGSGLGEQQSLRVSRDGRATLQWHDRSDRPQPAAILDVGGDGQLVLQDGAPLLVKGRIEIKTGREVSIPLADGSQVDLGIGSFVIVASSPFEEIADDRSSAETGADGGTTELERRFEVESILGEATVVRPGSRPVVVSAGQVGIYVGGGPIAVGPAMGGAANEPIVLRQPPPPPSDVPPNLLGVALEGSGFPARGASLALTLVSAGQVREESCWSGPDGHFQLQLEHGADLDYAIVRGVGAPNRPMLGMLPPDAVRLRSQGQDRHFERALMFETSASLVGRVTEDSETGPALGGVQVVPCIVDEIFGSVMLWESERTVSDVSGLVRIDRLPTRLPHHQTLGLLLCGSVGQSSHVATFVPVPVRSGVLAAGIGSFVMKRQRPASLHWLPKNTQVTILEEVVGVPWRSVVRKHLVNTDNDGKVLSVDLGPGQLWLRRHDQGTEQVHRMYREATLLVGSSPVPLYRPVTTGAVPLHSEFRSMQPAYGTALEVVQSHRHQRLAVPQASNLAASLLVSAGSVPVGGAQVFEVSDLGGELGAAVRFLGFTRDVMGTIPLTGLGPTGQVIAIAPDGTVAMVANPHALFNVESHVQANGVAIVPPSLRPSGNVDWMALRFERIDSPLGGLRATAYRFAAAATGWEVGGLLPGSYRVYLGAAETSREVVVPVDGYIEIP